MANLIRLDDKEYTINNDMSIIDIYNVIGEVYNEGGLVTMTYTENDYEGMLMFDPLAFKTIEVHCEV